MDLKNVKGTLLNVTISVVVFAVAIYVADYIIESGSSDGDIWSEEAQRYNDSINLVNLEYSKLNPHGFTDVIRDKKKPDSTLRIMVLGDSFIFGDGMHYKKVWGHLLEDTINAVYSNVEVMSCGRNGWSTLDQYNFMQEEGLAYDPDIVVFGLVDNDPDMGDHKQSMYKWVLWFNRQSYMPGFIVNIINSMGNDDYSEWITKLYSVENLKKYEDLWVDMKDLLTANDAKINIALTPSGYYDDNLNNFHKVGDVLDRVGLPYINLYSIGVDQHKKYTDLELKANPANGHPGSIMNELFCSEVFKQLQELNYLTEAKPRHK